MVKKRLAVAVPASVISDTPHLREKTSKIGCIGRAAAIFRVDEVIVYTDNPKAKQRRDLDLVATLLSYMETPQYLRKRLFQLKPELQFAGILPPLRTPHHPLNRKARDLKVGEFREGVVVSKAKEGVLVDIGVERPALMRDAAVAVNKRLTVKVVRANDMVEVLPANRDEITEYWGYTVTVEPHSLKRVLSDSRYDLVIGTSKFASLFQEVAGSLREKWARARSVLIAFGAPTRGLFEIVRDEGVNLNDLADFVVNTLPGQGTETVRTEEALLATLAIFNVHFGI
jgi:predicted SPOUT superfamily RNA methylase MTH1